MKSDAELRMDVEEELSCEPCVDATAIGVAVKGGIVTLSGHVASHAEKVIAEQAAALVLGVHAIVTNLDVKLPGSRLVSDEDIARTALDALSWNTLIRAKTIESESTWEAAGLLSKETWIGTTRNPRPTARYAI